MSMLCSLYRIDARQSERLRQSPEAVGELLGLAAAPPLRASLWSRLLGRAPTTPKAAETTFEPIDEAHTFDLDDAWHVLHFLFSGRGDEGPWPASFLLAGGTEVGPDLGYGPARLFDAEEVRELAAFLNTQSCGALNAAYEPSAMEAADIYWQASRQPAQREQQVGGLWERVQALQGFVGTAADAHHPLLISIY